jgi:hypothetical protein
MNLTNSPVSQYIRVPKMSATNVQKRISPSKFLGTISSYASNRNCNGNADASETFNPSSNAEGCLCLASGDPIESVQVSPGHSYHYNVNFYSDTACADQVSVYNRNVGEDCYDAVGSSDTIRSVFVNIHQVAILSLLNVERRRCELKGIYSLKRRTWAIYKRY